MMLKFRYIAAVMLAVSALCSCGGPEPVAPDEPEPQTESAFAGGADISWVTEMESKGYKFYTASGDEMECTELMRTLGFNAIRLRVWVNPADGWCSAADVLAKARRASALGMRLMIDFHYSDSWADPGKQNIPAAWKSYDLDRLKAAVYDHTKSVLSALKGEGIDVAWVQVGNETNTGMLWEAGRVTDANRGADFIALANSGSRAAREVYPRAAVILHHSNAQDLAAAQWFFDLMKAGGADYDMMGLSLYPSYWSGNGYQDWKWPAQQAVANFSALRFRFGKDIMLVEFGMPASQPDKAAEALTYLLDSTASSSWFKGIFYWEPEAEHGRNNYDYGAFSDGRPTAALAPIASHAAANSEKE